MRVGAVILAGGASRRLGRPKQLAPLAGRPILQHVLDRACEVVGDVVVVLGHEAEAVTSALRIAPGVRVAVNPDHLTGQASSLSVGLASLGPEVAAAAILLGDQPEIRVDAIRSVLDAARSRPEPVVRASYSGVAGHPVLVRRALWPRVAALRGDVGIRALLAEEPDLGTAVEVGGAPPADVDTEADYLALLARVKGSRE